MLMPRKLAFQRTLVHVLTLTLLLFPGAEPGAAATALELRLQFLLDAAVDDGLPGVSLRVTGPGIDFSRAAGVANLATGEALTPQHVMYVASLGKTFTAVIALQLSEEGRLDLDAPISDWLAAAITQRIPASDAITLRHLLSHTSGLIDYMNDQAEWRTDFADDPHRRWSHSDVLAYIYGRPLLFEPGRGYHYSNSNYVLAGLIIEQLTGKPLHALVRERILGPLGMQHTYNGNENVRDCRHAHGYVKWRGRVLDTWPWYRHYGLADSGMHSTPEDLARFMTALFSGDTLLGEAMRGQMTRASKRGQPPSEYGLGIYVQRNPWGAGQLWYAHDGIDPGYQADMLSLPAKDLVIVLAANASMDRASRVYEKLITAVVRVVLESVQ